MTEKVIETCWNCNGSGILVFNNVLLGMTQPSGTPKSFMVSCPTCGGTGKTSYEPRKKQKRKKNGK